MSKLYVVRKDGLWMVLEPGWRRSADVFETRTAALDFARGKADETYVLNDVGKVVYREGSMS